MIEIVNHDYKTRKMYLSLPKDKDGEEPFKYAIFNICSSNSMLIAEVLESTLKTQCYKMKDRENGYFLIFKVLDSSPIIVGGQTITEAHGNILVKIRGFDELSENVGVSFSLLGGNNHTILFEKRLGEWTGNVYPPVANQCVLNLLTCERDIIAEWGILHEGNTPFSSLELFISDQRAREMTNKTGLMLAQKWLSGNH